MFPSDIPDLSTEDPLIVSGRYRGKFPENMKAKGVSADMSTFVMDLKAGRVKDIPLDRVRQNFKLSLFSSPFFLCLKLKFIPFLILSLLTSIKCYKLRNLFLT